MRDPALCHSKEDPNQQLLAPKSLDSIAVDIVTVVAVLPRVMTNPLTNHTHPAVPHLLSTPVVGIHPLCDSICHNEDNILEIVPMRTMMKHTLVDTAASLLKNLFLS